MQTLNIQCAPLERFLADPGRFAIFGASACGRGVHDWLVRHGARATAFLDNARSGELGGIEVLPPREWARLELETVVIGSMYGREMSAELRALGFTGAVIDLSALHVERWIGHFDARVVRERADAVAAARPRLADESARTTFDRLLAYRRTLDAAALPEPSVQYRHARVPVLTGEVVLDGGAFDGRTSVAYLDAIGDTGHVHAFEPVAATFAALCATVETRGLSSHVTPWKHGLWHRRERLLVRTEEENAMQCRVHEDGDEEIDAVTIDEWVAGQDLARLDWIKMDIEGAEREALLGARDTLARLAPKLAICCYHRPDDLWELPLLIGELMPGARLFLGHHSQNLFESVVYALPAA